jgi:hypothetical protein
MSARYRDSNPCTSFWQVIFAMAWNQRPDLANKFRLAIGSFIDEYQNKIQVSTWWLWAGVVVGWPLLGRCVCVRVLSMLTLVWVLGRSWSGMMRRGGSARWQSWTTRTQ